MPYHDASSYALEFEVLVARSARRGRLDIVELLEPFVGLATHYGQQIADPRRLDVHHVAAALAHLPVDLSQATRLQVVDNLAAFHSTAVDPNTPWPGARSADGTLWIACPDGLASLRALAIALCTVTHEGQKWRRLLAEHGTLRRALLAGEGTALRDAAAVLGQDVNALQIALAQTCGTLWRSLDCETLPPIELHAALHVHLSAAMNRHRAQQILTALTELGLAHRPLHLWIGGSIVTETLSPYCRDLGAQLLVWGQREGCLTTPANDTKPADKTDVTYAVLDAFIDFDPRLRAEKATAERTVGLQPLQAQDFRCDIVDTGRLDPTLWDDRLTAPIHAGTPAAVILRLDADAGGVTGHILPHLLVALSAQMQSITVVTPGHLADATTGQVGVLSTMRPWHGGPYGHLQRRPATLSPEGIIAQGGSFVAINDALDVPFPTHGAPHLWLRSNILKRQAITFGQVSILTALQNYQLCDAHGAAAPICWTIVHGVTPHYQRDPQCLAGHASVARAGLLHILSAPSTLSAGQPSSKETPAAPNSAGKRGVRLRA